MGHNISDTKSTRLFQPPSTSTITHIRISSNIDTNYTDNHRNNVGWQVQFGVCGDLFISQVVLLLIKFGVS